MGGPDGPSGKPQGPVWLGRSLSIRGDPDPTKAPMVLEAVAWPAGSFSGWLPHPAERTDHGGTQTIEESSESSGPMRRRLSGPSKELEAGISGSLPSSADWTFRRLLFLCKQFRPQAQSSVEETSPGVALFIHPSVLSSRR